MKNVLKAGFLLGVFLLFNKLQTTAQTFTNSTPIAFTTASNGSPVCKTISVTGLPNRLTKDFGLKSITLNVTHPDVSDLKINLISPNGTTVTIIEGAYLSGANLINTVLTSSSSTLIKNASSPYTGSFKPSTFSYSTFCAINDSINIGNGNWQICVVGNLFSLAGTINSVSLSFGTNATSAFGINTPSNSINGYVPFPCSLSSIFMTTNRCYGVSDTAGTNLTSATTGFAIDNNSWIQFYSEASILTLTIQVGNCSNAKGVQLSALLSSDKTTFTNASNVGTILPGTTSVTLNNLIPGQNYYLMIDGWAGDECEFTIINSSFSGNTVSSATASPPSICSGGVTQLNVTGGVTYSWTPTTGLNNPNISNPIASPTTPTTYTATYITSNGCTRTDSVKVNISNASAGFNTMSSGSPYSCGNKTIALTAWDSLTAGGFITPGIIFEVTTDGVTDFSNAVQVFQNGILVYERGPSSTSNVYKGIIPNSTTISYNIPNLNPSSPITLVWCDKYNTGKFPYKIYDLNNKNLLLSGTWTYPGGSTPGSCNLCNCFTVTIPPISGTATFSGPGVTNFGNGTGSFNPSIAGAGTHSITYTWNGPGGCLLTASQTIQVIAPTVNAGADTTLCGGASVILNGLVNMNGLPITAPITFTSSSTTAITTANTVSSSIPVSGINPGILASNPIVSVCINLDHNFVGLLEIQLQSPSGTIIFLSKGRGSSGKNFTNTCFSTSAATSITSITAAGNPYSGSYRPENAFSGLTGNINGTWNLVIKNGSSVTAGMLKDWSITFNSTTTYAWTPSATLSSPTTLTTTATPSTNTTYTLTVTEPSGCTVSDQIDVNIGTPPSAPNPVNASNCGPGMVAISVNGCSGNVNWYANAFGGIPIYTGPSISILTSNDTTLYAACSLNGCESTRVPVSISIYPLPNTNFDFSPASVCQSSSSNPLPTIYGNTGGIFNSSPAGLIFINNGTGEIDLLNSAVGIYTITYSITGICPSSSSFTFEIYTNPGNAAFSYPTPLCSDSVAASPVMVGNKGTFTSSSAGLNINASTGNINPSLSSPGFYTVYNTLSSVGGCSFIIDSTNVNIISSPNASFSGLNPYYCNTDLSSNLTPTTGSGTFSGLGITGVTFDPASAGIGTHTINYSVTVSGCTSTSSQIASVDSSITATINSSGSTVCVGQSVTLSSSSTVSHLWSTGSNANSITVNTSGTYSLTLVNGACSSTEQEIVAVLPKSNPNFSYSQNTFCKNLGLTPLPSIPSGNTGSFSSSPIGLSLNTNSGSIDVDASTSGIYQIKFVTNVVGECPDSSNFQVEILGNLLSADFLLNPSYCLNDINPSPIVSGISGVFSSSPAGISIDPSTGIIDLLLSSAGNYTITNTVSPGNGCASISYSNNLTLLAVPDPNFIGLNPIYCQNDLAFNLTPNTTGGLFSGNGISGNSFDPASAGIGNHVIKYLISNAQGCKDSLSQSVRIDSLIVANISATGGFTSCNTPISLVSSTLTGNTWSTGATSSSISVTSSGMYSLTVNNGSCVSTSNQLVSIDPINTASLSYSSGSYCQGTGALENPNTGGSTGVFSSSPAGLVIDPNNGQIDIDGSAMGNYTIKYITNGICPDSITVNLSIIVPPGDASFSYSSNSFCTNDPNPLIILGAGASAGSFSSSPLGLSLNATTGTLLLSASAPNTYTVTNSLNPVGGCPAVDDFVTITILATPDSSFTGLAATYCQDQTIVTLTPNDPTGLFSGAGISGFNFDPFTAGAGTHTITYALTNGGCSNFSQQIVQIDSLIVATITSSGSNVCSGQSVTLTSSSSIGNLWNTGATSNSITVSSTGNYLLEIFNGTCYSSTQESVVIQAKADSSFSYSNNSYCQGFGQIALASINSGVPGVFSSSPVGLIFLDATIGSIDVDASIANTYSLIFNTNEPAACQTSSSLNFSIQTSPGSANFSYSSNSVCQNEGNLTVLLGAGASSGSFSATPSGLIIDPSSGEIFTNLSAPNTYIISNFLGSLGGCPTLSKDTLLTIKSIPNANFTGLSASYCQNNNAPVNLSPSSGVYSGAGISGFSFIPSLAPAGINEIKHIVIGGNACTDTASIYVNIDSLMLAKISADKLAICPGTSAKLYSASTVGNFWSTSETTDTIYVSAGNYLLTVVNGLCSSSDFIQITTLANDDASFAYSARTYCTGGSYSPAPSKVSPGIFSSTPAGLSINPLTGVIDLSLSSPNGYLITFTTSGNCSAVSSDSVYIINPPGNPVFSYAPSYCLSNTVVSPTTFVNIGTFSSTPNGLNIDPLTGDINLNTSVANTYTITNNLTSGGCSASHSVSLLLIDQPDSRFTFGGSPVFCKGISSNPVPVKNTPGVNGIFTSNPSSTLTFVDPISGEINISNTLPGTYTILFTPSGLCAVSDSITLVIEQDLRDSSFTFLSQICTGSGIQLAQNLNDLSGVFDISPPLLTINSSTGAINPLGAMTGTYLISYTLPSINSCGNKIHTQSIRIEESPDSLFSLSAIGPYCENDAATINLSQNSSKFPGIFYLNGTVLSNPLFVPQSLGNGNYTIDYSSTNFFCNSASQQNFVIDKMPNASYTLLSAPNVCEGNSISVQADSINNAYWKDQSGNIINSSLLTLIQPGLYNYSLTVTQGVCTSISNGLSLEIYPKPNGKISGNSTVCIGSPVVLNAPAGYTNYTWSTGDFNKTLIKDTLFVEKTYWLTFTDANNCFGYDSLTIRVSNPNAFFTASPENGKAILEVNFDNQSTNAYDWTWNLGDGTILNNNDPITHLYPNSGSYWVSLSITDTLGCTDTYSKEIIVEQDLAIWIPSAFTPNGDFNNEIFNIYVEGMKSYKVSIFDRWGHEVSKWDHLNPTGWNGYDKDGSMMGEGVFVYYFKGIGKDDKTYQKSGHVTLIR